MRWEKQYVFQQHSRISSFLKLRLGEVYAHLLAEPYYPEKQRYATWSSVLVSENAQPLGQLQGAPRAAADALLARYTGEIEKLVGELKQSGPEDVAWANLVGAAFTIPSDDCIFYEEGKLLFVAWGFEESSGHSLSVLEFDRDTGTRATDPFVVDAAADVPEEAKTYSAGQPEKERPPVPVPLKEDEGDTTGNPPGRKRGRLFTWGVPLALIAVAGLFLLKKCAPVGDAPGKLLPDAAGVLVPVDSSKIVKDSSGLRYIVSDRINLLLKGQNRKHIREFAAAFKKIYPGKDYRIIYYDTAFITRVQITVPEESRAAVQQEIKDRFKAAGFEIEVSPEMIHASDYIPDDPAFFDPDRDKTWYERKVKAPEAWELSRGSSDIKIGIVDVGFDILHEDLQDKIEMPWNVFKRNAAVDVCFTNEAHGTHVAGTAAGMGNNGVGTAGIAPNCTLIPVQVGNSYGMMPTAAIIDGIIYAIEQGASVINISLGMRMPEEYKNLPVTLQEQIAARGGGEAAFWETLYQEAALKGVAIVQAAGNDDVLIGLDPMKRSKNCIIVSATTPGDERAEFSNFGPGSTISAPGVQVFNCYPHNRYGYMDGTSMAAPIVAGGVGLMKSINPSLTVPEIITILQSTALKAHTDAQKPIGGIIQLDAALRKLNGGAVNTCTDIQQEIERLQQRITDLKRQCPGYTTLADTLKLPPGGTGMGFLSGKWKSTTSIVSVATHQPVILYFSFNEEGDGLVEFNERGMVYTAPLKAQMVGTRVYIAQRSFATCAACPGRYSLYDFTLSPDASGTALGIAQNSQVPENRFDFRLIKN